MCIANESTASVKFSGSFVSDPFPMLVNSDVKVVTKVCRCRLNIGPVACPPVCVIFILDHFQLFYLHSQWTVEDDVANYIYFLN